MEEGIKCLKLWQGVIQLESLQKEERSNHQTRLNPTTMLKNYLAILGNSIVCLSEVLVFIYGHHLWGSGMKISASLILR